MVVYEIPKHVLFDDSQPLKPVVIDNGCNIDNKEFLFKGRFPENENEILFSGRLAERYDLGIDGAVALTLNNRTEEYRIVGLMQRTNNNGNDCCLLIEGCCLFLP